MHRVNVIAFTGYLPPRATINKSSSARSLFTLLFTSTYDRNSLTYREGETLTGVYFYGQHE